MHKNKSQSIFIPSLVSFIKFKSLYKKQYFANTIQPLYRYIFFIAFYIWSGLNNIPHFSNFGVNHYYCVFFIKKNTPKKGSVIINNFIGSY